MSCHQSAVALSRSGAGGVRPNRTMSYLDHLRRPLWDHQYRHYCHHHEYQSRRQDPQAGSPIPSASGGTEPPRSGRRRTQPAAESAPPDPRAHHPPFRPSPACHYSHLALSPIPPSALAPPHPSPPPSAGTPCPDQPWAASPRSPCERERDTGPDREQVPLPRAEAGVTYPASATHPRASGTTSEPFPDPGQPA